MRTYLRIVSLILVVIVSSISCETTHELIIGTRKPPGDVETADASKFYSQDGYSDYDYMSFDEFLQQSGLKGLKKSSAEENSSEHSKVNSDSGLESEILSWHDFMTEEGDVLRPKYLSIGETNVQDKVDWEPEVDYLKDYYIGLSYDDYSWADYHSPDKFSSEESAINNNINNNDHINNYNNNNHGIETIFDSKSESTFIVIKNPKLVKAEDLKQFRLDGNVNLIYLPWGSEEEDDVRILKTKKLLRESREEGTAFYKSLHLILGPFLMCFGVIFVFLACRIKQKEKKIKAVNVKYQQVVQEV